MWAFLVKDILLLLRDRSELLILLAMPFLLIAILGFSLRGIFSGDLEALEMDVALVTEDNEQQALDTIHQEIDSLGIPGSEAETLKQAAVEISPKTMLVSMLESEELRELITLEAMDKEQAVEELEAENVHAVIIIPDGFTQSALSNMLFGTASTGELNVLTTDLSAPQSDVLSSLLTEFVETLNFEAAASRLSGQAADVNVAGGIETITSREPISSFQYYTVGMAVMFVLFVASTIGAQANLEQKQMVFDRIRLSNRPPISYLVSKALATVIIVTVQLAILFGFSNLFFQMFPTNSWSFWLGIAIISISLAVAVGCLAALLVALTLRIESDAVPAIFSGGVISLMAFVGGSFLPTDGMPELIREIGNWTPNGAALSAYFSWLLDPDITLLYSPLLRIGVVALVFLAIALVLFPRKGRVS